MTATVARVLSVARSQIGYREGANNDTKFGKAYGLNHQPWCGMFQWWVFDQADALDLVGGRKLQAYTPTFANWFQDAGRWGQTPKVGAVVFFNWGAPLNRISHVGLVEAVHADGSFTTIEGNTNTAGGREGLFVMRQRRRREAGYVAGFGYPKYDPAPVPYDKRPLPSATGGMGSPGLLEVGVRSAAVAAVNAYHGLGGSLFTDATRRAVLKSSKALRATGSDVRTDGKVDLALYHAYGRAARRKAAAS